VWKSGNVYSFNGTNGLALSETLLWTLPAISTVRPTKVVQTTGAPYSTHAQW
jgi:hypothetical protein